MHLLRDLPIKNKLRLTNLVSSALVLLLVATAFIAYDLVTSRQRMKQDLFILANIVGMNSNAGLVFDEASAIQDTVMTLKANPHIISGHVFNAGDVSIAEYHRDKESDTELHEDLKLESEELKLERLFEKSVIDDIEPHVRDKEYLFFHDKHVDVYYPIMLDKRLLGTVFLRSDLKALEDRLKWALVIVFVVLAVALVFSSILTTLFQRAIITPLFSLLQTMHNVSQQKNYSLREVKESNDEIGKLVDGFNQMLATIEIREQELAVANQEITELNDRLKAENLRMGAELDITRRLQTMILPRDQELSGVADLDIAGIMEPADEVGGDYYDVLTHDGKIKIGIGDVTGHGLESGVLMLMVQMAVRILFIYGVMDSQQFIGALNRAVFENMRRMGSDKNLTLSLFDYDNGHIRFAGQHEEVLVVRKNGQLERIDTFALGFMIGIEPDITKFMDEAEVFLESGDGIVLYTDGITEARNIDKKMYGVEQLCTVIQQNWHLSSSGVRQAVLKDLHRHIGVQKILDDITLLVLKRQ